MYERCKNNLLVVSGLSITIELYVQFYVTCAAGTAFLLFMDWDVHNYQI